jgi:aminoglycoside/choline kinase family phosphotransferase
MTEIKENLTKLFEKWAGETPTEFYPLPPSGSERQYFRIKSKSKNAIGVFNPDKKENKAFLSFSEHFAAKGLSVPRIYARDLRKNIYLEEDLGDTTLFAFLTALRKNGEFPSEAFDIYKKVLEELPRFQIEAAKDLDFSVCYPRKRFDRQSMMWDLNYFKYYFLKLAKIPFEEQGLEKDFKKFTDFLLSADRNYFLYRDFQSRNVMLLNNKPYFIDYQGGRKGALQYDVASLLYDAKADIPQPIRNELLRYYMDVLSEYMEFDRHEFVQYYYGYVLIRILQAMGAYGFRGFYERKEHFLESIPYAIENLEWFLENVELPVKLPHLFDALRRMVRSKSLKKFSKSREYKLKVTITSFSYKKGIPNDDSGNGGGFVFDCRGLLNPGRFDEYKLLNGKDAEVIDFLEQKSEVKKYLRHVFGLVDLTVENYITRKFTHLMVNFGCTGGQHRSVYCAEALAKHLSDKYDVNVNLTHTELSE